MADGIGAGASNCGPPGLKQLDYRSNLVVPNRVHNFEHCGRLPAPLTNPSEP